LANNWTDAVESRSRAIVLSAILALLPLAAWIYGMTNVLPPTCVVEGTSRRNPCTLMSESRAPFPVDWNGLLVAVFLLFAIVGAALILRPHDKNVRLLFLAAGAVVAAVSALQLLMLIGLPNAAQFLTFNTAWLVVPGVVSTAAAFAAVAVRTQN